VTQNELLKYRSRWSLGELVLDSELLGLLSPAFPLSDTSNPGWASPLLTGEAAGGTPPFSASRFFTRFSSLAILLRSSPSGFRRLPCLPLGTRERVVETQTTPARKQLEQGLALSHLTLRRRHRLQLASFLDVPAAVWLCSSEAGGFGVCNACCGETELVSITDHAKSSLQKNHRGLG
jgi:hypothetical protein